MASRERIETMDEQQRDDAYPYADELNDLAGALRLRTERVLGYLRGGGGEAAAMQALGEMGGIIDSLRESHAAVADQLS
jgi:hypothetical protein